jgi:hypothetical protein
MRPTCKLTLIITIELQIGTKVQLVEGGKGRVDFEGKYTLILPVSLIDVLWCEFKIISHVYTLRFMGRGAVETDEMGLLFAN